MLRSAVAEEDEIDTVGGTTDTTDTPPTIIPPPLGFSQFSWPYEDWSVGDEPSLFTFTKELPGWFPGIYGGLPVDMPSPPLSPIIPDSSDDSVREELITPSEVIVIGPSARDVLPVPTDAEIQADSPLPTAEGLLADLLWALVAPRPQGISGHGDQCSSDRVPRWQLAREGPFLVERSNAALSSFGAGCAFRNTSYRASDYVSPSGEFGIPLNHPRFLEWIGVPELASLLEMGLEGGLMPYHEIRLWQWPSVAVGCVPDDDEFRHSGPLSLQGTASKMLERSLGASDFPSTDVATGALGPRVRRAAVQMEAMGLWWPSLDPIHLN